MIYIYEYIWLDCDDELRSKTKVSNIEYNINTLPLWNYDGSSTGQAQDKDSEIILKPVSLFNDPFRTMPNSFLVLCENYTNMMIPLESNLRVYAITILDMYNSQEPWFGLEQEYFIINPGTGLPLGFTQTTSPKPQSKYYCGIGTENSFGRNIVEKHLEYCIKANIKIGGINAEVAPGQWEFQIGPLDNVQVSDHLWIARYILNRVAEEYGYSISYHPKPLGVNADWNGSGCHTNFSTKEMRENDNGYDIICNAIKNLELNHEYHIKHYGKDNNLRLSGKYETSSINKFNFGIGNRSTSVRIPNETFINKKGYFEDRRPASNINPYVVTTLILETINKKMNTFGNYPVNYII